MAPELDDLAGARESLAELDRRASAGAVALRDAREQLAELVRAGKPAAERRVLERSVARLVKEQGSFAIEREAHAKAILDLREVLFPRQRLEDLVGGLDAGAPVVLLPVRLETRYTANRRALRVRIFPDAIHVPNHDDELTPEERAAAETYWRDRWTAGDDDARRAAWTRLTAALSSPPRAAFAAEALTPSNVGDLGDAAGPAFPDVPLKPAPWHRAPRAELLPDRWVLLGYRGNSEVLRKWGAPIPDDLVVGPVPDPVAPPEPSKALPPDADQPELAGGGLGWLVDYAEAERVGMAVTVTDADVGGSRVAAGFDLLMVLGVDWTLTPDAAARRLEGLLRAHRFSAGVSLLRQATPTNTTADLRPPPRLDGTAGTDPLDPGTPAPAVDGNAGARRVARALGLSESALDRAPGAAEHENVDARHMQNALWEVTWGYFLDQLMDPLVDDATAAALRGHATAYVRGRGPLPAVRVGDQPYGLLPVLAPGQFRPRADGDLEHDIFRRAAALRRVWGHATRDLPQLGRSNRPDEDLLEILRTTPRSASFRFREAVGPVLVANTSGYDLAALLQGFLALMLLGSVGIDGGPYIVMTTLDEEHRRLTIPLVQRGALSEEDRLTDDYIRGIAAEVRTAGGFARLLRHQRLRGTLLDSLLSHAAQLEVAKAAARTVADFEVESGRPTIRGKVAVREKELPGVVSPTDDGRFITSLDEANSTATVALKALRTVSGQKSLSNHFATMSLVALRRFRPTRDLAGFLSSLDHLADLPTAALERLLTETLDCASHRLDAWITSIAAARLDGLRDTTAAGAHVGGFGWVEGLRPATRSASQGYVHAPSLRHAAAAAVLRSGHLTHRDADAGILALDLSSDRVRLALEVLDGVREGQPVGALLGYRFERGLRERRLALAKYILPIRRLAPLATSTDAREGTEPLEAIAARDVVDGVRLLARWRAGAAAFFAQPDMPPAGPDRQAVTAELERLADVEDAMSDVLVSEAVYQAVSGNSERAGAALDALDRHTGLPEVQVVATPRTGTGFNHRLLLLLGDAAAPARWATDPRGAAEPRLNAWIARLLGDPSRIRFAAEALDAEGAVVQRLRVRLVDLKLSPLATVLAATSGSREQATEFEERLALQFAKQVTAATADSLRLLDTPPRGAPLAVIGLGELRTVARAVVELVSSSRFATARELAPDTERIATGVDDAELKTRADDAVKTLGKALNKLKALPAAPTVQRLEVVLLEAAAAGVRGAVPAAPDAAALRAQADVALETAQATHDAVKAAETGFDRAASDELQRAAHDLERLRAVLGAAFPAIPRFAPVNAAEIGASLSARATLLGGDDLAPAAWLQRMALIRPAVGRLHDVLTAAEALDRGVGARDLAVCQLPHAAGDRWLGLALPPERTLPSGTLSVVACAPDGLDTSRRLAGLIVDRWSETLPAVAQTTGLTFHYDAPGARAPQAILIAVPPDPAATAWDFDALLGAVREARELAKLRLVDLQSVDGASRFLPALWFPFNLQAESPWIDFVQMQNAEIAFANVQFLSENGGGG